MNPGVASVQIMQIGPFVAVRIDSHSLAFANYRGNRQLISTENLKHNDRVALFLINYPNRTRLKVLDHARVLGAREHSDFVAQLASLT